MAKWFKEHLGFKTTKAPPPAPPKPDYRHCHTGVPGAPGYQQTSSGATFPSPAQPDILAAYKLQKELDFEDPYTPGGNISFGPSSNTVGSPDIKYVSPKHRLIKVETIEKSSPAPGGGVTVTQAVAVGSVKSPTSPPADHDNNKEKSAPLCFAHVYPAEVWCIVSVLQLLHLEAFHANHDQQQAKSVVAKRTGFTLAAMRKPPHMS
ncbi:SH2 domain-containing adapter protein D [Collichthys lucidus]|uniref:SH2 domain-containing adapter protein D n=1 Tax=Collichthys lucidus TaxID=240159 RepID=A0A4U5U7W4_COLLU|nr:SH2 domain-containing adapter protein D [Collichthys lucidus]